jgi:hypothetical protein
MEFDTKNYVFPVVTSAAVPAVNGLLNNFAVTQRMHTIKFGINYRFGAWAYGGVMAAY